MARAGECLPGVPLSARQLYWVGYALDWCTIGGTYSHYSTYEQLLSSRVVSGRIYLKDHAVKDGQIKEGEAMPNKG
jgi:hypothetical protein